MRTRQTSRVRKGVFYHSPIEGSERTFAVGDKVAVSHITKRDKSIPIRIRVAVAISERHGIVVGFKKAHTRTTVWQVPEFGPYVQGYDNAWFVEVLFWPTQNPVWCFPEYVYHIPDGGEFRMEACPGASAGMKSEYEKYKHQFPRDVKGRFV